MHAQKRRILVVDDEPGITRMLKLNLEQTGDYEVMTENTASKAVMTALMFKPDLILLDVLMPGVDGGELASRFQASTHLGNIPIIFLTAAATKTEVNRMHHTIGGYTTLAKPVNLSEVISYLQRHLAGIRAPAKRAGAE